MKNYLTLLIIILLGNLTLSGQSLIEGSISNQDGAELSAVLITMRHTSDSNLNKNLTTDETGYFIMENIQEGTYQLEITHPGYQQEVIPDFQFPRDTDQVLGLEITNLSALPGMTKTAERTTTNKLSIF